MIFEGRKKKGNPRLKLSEWRGFPSASEKGKSNLRSKRKYYIFFSFSLIS